MLDRDSWILLADDHFQELQSRDSCNVGFILAAAPLRLQLVMADTTYGSLMKMVASAGCGRESRSCTSFEKQCRDE